jgi:hypothetical protein
LTKLYYPYVLQSYLAVNVYVRALWKLFHVVVQSRAPLDPHSKPRGPTCRDLARVYCVQIFFYYCFLLYYNIIYIIIYIIVFVCYNIILYYA